MFQFVWQLAVKRDGCQDLDLINDIGNIGCQSLMQYAVKTQNYEAVVMLALRGAHFRQKWMRTLSKSARQKTMAALKRAFHVLACLEEMKETHLPGNVVGVVYSFMLGEAFAASSSRCYASLQTILQPAVVFLASKKTAAS
jgi:hypothetical protein